MGDERFEKSQQRELLSLEYRHANERLAREGRRLTYPNQQEAANTIIEHFASGKHVVVLVAQPGVGKTGVALETAYRLATHADEDLCVLTKDCYSHSGMNDKEWTRQYTASMLPSLRGHVTHRSKIKNELAELSALTNGFVTTDECHIASDKRMTQSKILKEAGLLSIDNLVVKRNKLLNISATPEGILIDATRWGEKAALVILKPGEHYKGFQVMLDEQRIRNAPELTTLAHVDRLLRLFEDRYATSTKRFFPFRGVDPDVIVHMYTVAIGLGWDIIRHDSDEPVEHIDRMMSSAPAKHTIILIKDFWRASKRVIRTHVGGSYEKPPKARNTSATSQGLTARFCDTFVYTGDWLTPDLRPIHYCDIGAIEEYLEWFNSGCNYKGVVYTSAKLKSKEGRVRTSNTLLHPSNVDGLVAVEEEDAPAVDPYALSVTFPTKEEAHAWAISNINWSGEWNGTMQATRPLNVNPCGLDGGPGETHIRRRGDSHLIKTDAAFRSGGDFSQFGSGVRCVPVKTGATLSYVIVYKTAWI
jgi:hypothetical protein